MPQEQPIDDGIAVRLGPHKGVQQTTFGPIEVTIPQHVIYVNDRWAGYTSFEPGSHISMIATNIPEHVMQIIKTKVDALKGSISSGIHQATTLAENDVKAPEDDTEEEYDYEDADYDDAS